jgi:uncharacterized protein
MNEKDDPFLGRGWAFPPAFNFELGTVETVAAEEDIRQSIRIIIETIPGERIMFTTFGCGIRKYVFESNDPTHMSMLKDAIYDALLYNEPRIKLEKIDIDNYNQNEGLIHIHIFYTIIITNTRSNMVYPFYVNEGTNL